MCVRIRIFRIMAVNLALTKVIRPAMIRNIPNTNTSASLENTSASLENPRSLSCLARSLSRRPLSCLPPSISISSLSLSLSLSLYLSLSLGLPLSPPLLDLSLSVSLSRLPSSISLSLSCSRDLKLDRFLSNVCNPSKFISIHIIFIIIVCFEHNIR